MLMVCLFKLILESQNAFSLTLITQMNKIISIFLTVLIKLLILAVIMISLDFNAEYDEPYLSTFLCWHDLYKIVKVSTCFKNLSKSISIYLFLRTKSKHFQNTFVVCSGLCNFHKLVLTVLKISLDKRNTGNMKNSTLNLLMNF